MLVLLLGIAVCACTDVRDYEGTWIGPRDGAAAVLHVGVGSDATATLAIGSIDTHGIAGTLSISGLVAGASYASIAGAEADVLSSLTFDGSPDRVYLAFFPIGDGGGDGLAVIALYDPGKSDPGRVEVRVLRGGQLPLYGIFSLSRSGSVPS